MICDSYQFFNMASKAVEVAEKCQEQETQTETEKRMRRVLSHCALRRLLETRRRNPKKSFLETTFKLNSQLKWKKR